MKNFKETEKQIEKLKKQAETKKARLPKRVEKIDTMKKELVELSDETSIKQLKEKIAGRQEAYDGMVKWITKMEQDANELEKNLKDRKDKNYKERVALSRNKECDNEDKDELYETAIEIIKSEGKASTSFLQRKLQIGYNRAARIIDMMEENGVVSKANHVGKREILK